MITQLCTDRELVGGCAQGAEARAEPAKRSPWNEHRGGETAGPSPARQVGATHLSVKSGGRSGSRRVREGGVGDGRGQLRGVQRVGSPGLRGRWDESRSSQVI